MYAKGIVVVSILVFFGKFYCLQVIVERANVTYTNPKYVDYGKLYVTRHGRKSPYYINVEGRTLQAWHNNVTFNFVFYEYLHNEYRRSFVEIHIKFCDMMTGDPYIGGMLISQGVTCPANPKEYLLLNMSVPTENFPNVFPLEKCKVEVEFTITATGESIVKAYAYAVMKPGKKKG